MTGFKDGAASDDPFGSDDTDEETSASSAPDVDLSSTDTEDTTEETSSDGLPWIYRRNSITDGREKTVQLHLQQSTLDEQREAKPDVEQRLGESVKKADLREAALLVGLEHLDEVSAKLREWGYDTE